MQQESLVGLTIAKSCLDHALFHYPHHARPHGLRLARSQDLLRRRGRGLELRPDYDQGRQQKDQEHYSANYPTF
jgi:hypothetical protein